MERSYSLHDGVSPLFDRASSALVDMGAVAVPGLVQAMHDLSDERRLQAVDVLGRIGGAAMSASPDLTVALLDENELVRIKAAEAIGRFRSEMLRCSRLRRSSGRVNLPFRH